MEFAGNKEKEFAEYYKKYYRMVVNYTVKKIQNVQDAEDLAMDCFAKCYENFEKFDSAKATFQTWLFTVVNNRIKNYYRDHKYGEEIGEELASEERLEDTVVEAEYLSQMRTVLKDALENLNERQRELIILKYFKNMNSNEIADAVGMSAVNVRVTINRAMTALRDYFRRNNIELEL